MAPAKCRDAGVPGRARARLRLALVSLLSLAATGCTGLPPGVKAVDDFDVQRYLGRWYEIARLDHSFERGLSRVTATYELRKDGGIRVVNRGYDAAADEWREAVGKAYLIGKPGEARLKVSFFGPFYSGYNIIALGGQDGRSEGPYPYAMVCGPNRSYLWILARRPHLDASTLARLTERARALAFDTERLLYVEQAPAADAR